MIFSLKNTFRCKESIGSVKFLGVHLDPCLPWDQHENSLCKKLNSSVFGLHNLSAIISAPTLRVSYFALCHLLISCAILARGHAFQNNKSSAMQRRAIRIVLGLTYTEDCKQSFISLKILTLPSIYILECLRYLANYSMCESAHHHYTRHKVNLTIPYFRIKRTQTVTIFGA